MKRLVHSSQFTVHRLKKTTNYQLPTTNCRQRRHGFTIIELLIVVSILGIASMIVTTSYLSFEKRERVKSGALEIKNQIRAAQNKALSGDKGFGSGLCPETSQLVGWYVRVNAASNNFEMSGVCDSGSGENDFSKKTMNLPKGVTISNVSYNLVNVSPADILFRPTDNEVKFFNVSTIIPFLTGGKVNPSRLIGGGLPQSPLLISLVIEGSQTSYEVKILPTGSVNERKQ